LHNQESLEGVQEEEGACQDQQVDHPATGRGPRR